MECEVEAEEQAPHRTPNFAAKLLCCSEKLPSIVLRGCCRVSLGACELEAVVLVDVFCIFFFFPLPPPTRGKGACSECHSNWGDEPWKASAEGVKARALFMPELLSAPFPYLTLLGKRSNKI